MLYLVKLELTAHVEANSADEAMDRVASGEVALNPAGALDCSEVVCGRVVDVKSVRFGVD